MGYFKFKRVGGGGFTTKVEAIIAIKPAKKREHALVLVRFGGHHGHSNNGKVHVETMTAMGCHKKMTKRLAALRAAG